MRIGKVCFLLDPDKPEVENVFNASVKLREIFDKRFLNNLIEYWIGGTTVGSIDMMKLLINLKNNRIGPRFIFPGSISQAVFGYNYADALLVPYLLNCTNKLTYLHDAIGIKITRSWKRKIPFGYLVLSDKSSVGRAVGARNISNEEAVTIVRKFLSNGGSKTVYLEAGSGSKRPSNIKLIEEVSRLVKNYNAGSLIVGGGIKSAAEVKKMFSMGVDKVVIGTALEQTSIEKSLDAMIKIIKPLETLNKN